MDVPLPTVLAGAAVALIVISLFVAVLVELFVGRSK